MCQFKKYIIFRKKIRVLNKRFGLGAKYGIGQSTCCWAKFFWPHIYFGLLQSMCLIANPGFCY